MRKKIFVSLGGYVSDGKKTAVCHTISTTFSVIALPSEETVFSGVLSEPADDPDSGEQIRIADFSSVTREGTYCIRCGYRRSESFVISPNAYEYVKEQLRAGFLLNRCGFDFSSGKLPEKYSEFHHSPCHGELTPLYYGSGQLDVTGGWHEGSGYGKFVTASASACAFMMYSQLLYPESFANNNSGLPDILDECRWGLEWLLKMQAPDGRVYHKCDTADAILSPPTPNEDTQDYFVFPASADAAMMFTAAAALGAKVFEEKDCRFSRTLSRAASNSWLWIVNYPAYEPWKLPAGTSPCGVADASYEYRGDTMLWLLAEMYSLTGSEVFSKRFEELVFSVDTTGFTLENTGGFGALAYLTCSEKKNQGITFYLKKKFGDKADKIIFAMSSGAGYGTALGIKEGGYNALSNMTVLSDCIICQTAYILFGSQRYRAAAFELFQYILGRNPSGISYITGVGESFPLRPAHAQSVSGQSRPVPGMVVSGANARHEDEFSRWRLSSKTPPAKCYIDNECSISTNAPSAAFGGAALMAAAFFDKSDLSSDSLSLKDY